MNYYLDTEFIEGTQKTWFGQTKPTIDLISIGIFCEDGREYYAISKDFNLKEAWNRYDKIINKQYPLGPQYNKVYWIRDNVLYPIYLELSDKELHEQYHYDKDDWNFKEFKRLIKKYGKSNKQIAEEIIRFVMPSKEECNINDFSKYIKIYSNPKFYGYYSDYDWVVFCWLFGKMIDLPKGFPMYCIDLKQTLDEKEFKIHFKNESVKNDISKCMYNTDLSHYPNYPKQTNEHNALSDAKWNFELYKFLNTL